MKYYYEIVVGIIIGLLIVILCTAGNAADYQASFKELKGRLDTPIKVYNYLARYISYQYTPNRKPYQSAYQTYLCGYAGCTDVAQFAYEVLTEHGYQCQIYEVWNYERGHSFTIVLNEDGTYSNLSVYRPTKYKFSTIEGAAFQQYPNLVGYKRVK